MQTKKVEVVPYSRTWPAEFEKIHGLLTAALGPCALKIEHVGTKRSRTAKAPGLERLSAKSSGRGKGIQPGQARGRSAASF